MVRSREQFCKKAEIFNGRVNVHKEACTIEIVLCNVTEANSQARCNVNGERSLSRDNILPDYKLYKYVTLNVKCKILS